MRTRLTQLAYDLLVGNAEFLANARHANGEHTLVGELVSRDLQCPRWAAENAVLDALLDLDHEPSPDYWEVAMWAKPTDRLPIESQRCDSRETAEATALLMRRRVEALGQGYLVTVEKGMYQR